MKMIEPLLPRGEENALSTAELVRVTGFKSARELQKVIEAERAQGALILSVSGRDGGYFLPSEGEAGVREISRFVATLQARALNTLRSLRAAKAALEQCVGQIEAGV